MFHVFIQEGLVPLLFQGNMIKDIKYLRIKVIKILEDVKKMDIDYVGWEDPLMFAAMGLYESKEWLSYMLGFLGVEESKFDDVGEHVNYGSKRMDGFDERSEYHKLNVFRAEIKNLIDQINKLPLVNESDEGRNEFFMTAKENAIVRLITSRAYMNDKLDKVKEKMSEGIEFEVVDNNKEEEINF